MHNHVLIVSVAAFGLLAGGCEVSVESNGEDSAPTETAAEFIDRINLELDEIGIENAAASWVQANFITADTALLAARSDEKFAKLLSESVAASQRYDTTTLDPVTARALELLKLNTSEPAPNDAAKRRALAEVVASLKGKYGSGKFCPNGPNSCLSLGDLEEIMAGSHDYEKNLQAWVGWRTVAPAMRDDYARFVELTNEGARELGFSDLAEMWKSNYDMSPAEFETESARLWSQVEPLYDELHCYVRGKLGDHYGADKVPADAPIPAHLLGNMWAQTWGEIYSLVEPYSGVADLDVDRALTEQGWTADKMVRTAEAFFVSLGLPNLPDTFYERSLFEKPRDRDVVCHASAWALDGGKDPRIKMCIEPTHEMLTTIYHELGHIYYYIEYVDQPSLYRTGAHDGFHEGIGDTVVLSMTPAFLKQLGLVSDVAVNDEAVINAQMKLALDKIAFLPFGKMVDEWRWRVFAGDVTPDNYNESWWDLRTRYQGVAPPVARDESHFDPGAKYHIPANTPYTRYFLSHILQFQFHRSLCEAAGFTGPLHECSIFGSKEAGARLEAMLEAGAGQPWQDTLEKLTGTREMDASAIIDYFAPLLGWLKAENEGLACGW